jgi:hypothetical protein
VSVSKFVEKLIPRDIKPLFHHSTKMLIDFWKGDERKLSIKTFCLSKFKAFKWLRMHRKLETLGHNIYEVNHP